MEPLRWGVMGTGNIAHQFTDAMKGAKAGRVVAVGSRRAETADAFAQRHAIAAAHASYEALLADPKVEAIYLSLPNTMHHEWTIRSLRAGKHVLCEKPFAIDAAQGEEMFTVARQKGLVLAEAFMFRSHPQTLAVLDAIRDGAVGELRLIRTSFCYRTRKIEGNIRFDRSLAGGALLDVGCYCVSFARTIAGTEPTKVWATSRIHENGVDENTSGMMAFPNGVMSTFTCGMSVQFDNTASIGGGDGYIDITMPWKPTPETSGYTLAQSAMPRMDMKAAGLAQPGDKPKPPPAPTRSFVPVAVDRPLAAFEADDFARAVRGLAPPRVDEAHTLGNLRILDEMRRQIGLSW